MAAPTTQEELGGYGQSVKRKEDPRFLRGKGNYIDDIKLPGMLYMDITRSPFAHAKITNITTQPALDIPGVVAVITGKDLDAAGLAWMPTLMSDRQMVLPVDTVMYQMQEVAAVIADSRYAAADGAAAVEVDYEPLQVVVDPFKALEPDAPLLAPRSGDQEQPHLPLGGGRRRGDRQGVRGCRRRRRAGHVHPAHPRRLDRDLRLRGAGRSGQRQADGLDDDAGPARDPHRLLPRLRHSGDTRSASSPPTSAAGSAARCRSIRATSSPSWRR